MKIQHEIITIQQLVDILERHKDKILLVSHENESIYVVKESIQTILKRDGIFDYIKLAEYIIDTLKIEIRSCELFNHKFSGKVYIRNLETVNKIGTYPVFLFFNGKELLLSPEYDISLH